MRRSGWCVLIVVWGLAGMASSTAQAVDQRLIDATRKLDVGAVRALLKQRVDVNATAADGFTALHWAAQRNNLQLVDLLLGAGANAKASNRYNITPLYHAALNVKDERAEALDAYGGLRSETGERSVMSAPSGNPARSTLFEKGDEREVLRLIGSRCLPCLRPSIRDCQHSARSATSCIYGALHGNRLGALSRAPGTSR